MIRKLVVVLLFAVLAQASFAVRAGLHFPVTADVNNSATFNGTAGISGYGSSTDFVQVTVTLSSNSLVALCKNQGGNIAPGQISSPLNVSQVSPLLTPNANGNYFFQFQPISLLPSLDAAGCPNTNWTVSGVQGTLTGNYNAKEYDSTLTILKAEANVPFTCTLDGVNSTVCAQGKEVHVIYR